MKYSAILTFDKDVQIQGIKDVEAHAAGTEALLPAFADGATDLEFSDLERNLNNADAAANKESSINSSVARANLVYAAALYRDAQYAAGGRKFMQALSVHGGARSLYDVGRKHVDLNGG